MTNQVTLNEAASFLGVSKPTLRNWDRAGKLHATRHPINGYRLYDLESLRTLKAQYGMFPEDTMGIEVQDLDARSIRRVISRLHSILRDTDGQSTLVLRFDEITKLLFAKIIADREEIALSPFNPAKNVGPGTLRNYYDSLSSRFSALIPEHFRTLACSDNSLLECLNVLKLVDFRNSSIDVAGLAYEEVIKNTFDKGDHQQFFTPPSVVEFMVSLCASDLGGRICDPASGTGGFLTSIARRGLLYESLTAFEIDERLSWVTAMNLLLHEAHDVNIHFLPQGGTLGPHAKPFFSSFDTIITNPPFGSDFSDRAVLNTMTLGQGRQSRRRGILFIEQCHALLRDQGLLAIVIDEGVLNLPHAEDVRNFILERFRIEAVVGLPETTFMPYATVNASIVLLRKRDERSRQNREVFFARAESVGRKPNGDDDVRYDREGKSSLNSDFPALLMAWEQMKAEEPLGVDPRYFVADIVGNFGEEDSGHRLDFQSHHPSRRAVRDMLKACPYPLVPLGDLCSERNIAVIPSQELSDTVIPYTGLAHIESFTGKAQQVHTPANSLKSGVKVCEPGDILFARMRPNLRKVSYVDFPEPGYTSPECAVLVPKTDAVGSKTINPELLAVLLRSDLVFGQIMHLVAGIGRPRISMTELRQVLIPVPPAKTQRDAAALYQQMLAESLRIEVEAERSLAEAEHMQLDAVQRVATCFMKGIAR